MALTPKQVISAVAALTLACWLLTGCASQHDPREEGRIVVQYWEKWTGFEGQAIQGIVDDFNASQDRIYVKLLTISNMDRKLALATSGGLPPDIAGIWSHQIPAYAENNALLPLGNLARKALIKQEDYLPIYWDLCSHRGQLWALPTTPATVALHYNRNIFKNAGLDPDQPPKTLVELERYNGIITQQDRDGTLHRLGHAPLHQFNWHAHFAYWFGGSWWDPQKGITANSPENIACFEWLAQYPKRYGKDNLLAFNNGFGQFASPQNDFFTGRVAMGLQGVWMHNFITHYAPEGFDWAVAPFPPANDSLPNDISLAECDALVIPNGAKHPHEAFEFIQYVNSQPAMERLCLAHRKFTPLASVSESFFKNNPHPHLELFYQLAQSPNVKRHPPLTIWPFYEDEIRQAYSNVIRQIETPQEALDRTQKRVTQAYQKSETQWARVSEQRKASWRTPLEK